MLKPAEIADTLYTPEQIEAARQDVIFLRDAALEQNDFMWSVRLSHIVGLLNHLKENTSEG